MQKHVFSWTRSRPMMGGLAAERRCGLRPLRSSTEVCFRANAVSGLGGAHSPVLQLQAQHAGSTQRRRLLARRLAVIVPGANSPSTAAEADSTPQASSNGDVLGVSAPEDQANGTNGVDSAPTPAGAAATTAATGAPPAIAVVAADPAAAASASAAVAAVAKAKAAAAAMMDQGEAAAASGGAAGAGGAPAGPIKTLMQNAIDIATFSLPLAAQNVLGYSLNALSESLVGRLGASSLSASTLANSTYSLVGLSVVWGGAAGMETLCGQAYGAGNRRLMRLILLRAVLVCWAVCVPVVALWSNAAPLLLALGQSPPLVAAATDYLRALAPSMFAYVLAECVQTYLVVQGIVYPTTIAKAVVTVLGPIYYYGCMFWMDMGLVGAGYAYALCKATNAALLLGWLAWRMVQGEAELPGEQPQGQQDGFRGGEGGQGQQTGGEVEQAGTAEGAAATWGAAAVDGSGSGSAPLRLQDLRLVEQRRNSDNGTSTSSSTGSSNPSSSGSSGRSSSSSSSSSRSGSSRSSGSREGNSHSEMLTSPLSASASAHEFSFPQDANANAKSSSKSTNSDKRNTSTASTSYGGAAAAPPLPAPVINAAAAPAAATAATAIAASSLAARLAGMGAALRSEAIEVLDPRACWEYVKFGFPAALMSCLEWWAYEALVIMAGWLPNAEVALGCLGICLTVGGWVYMVPQAIATAACARVSNALGAGDAVTAKRNFQAAYGLVLLTQLVVSSCLLPNAARVAYFFCPDPVAAALTATLLPITAVNTIGDGMNCVLNGILRACGRQALGARLHLMAYWCCGLPAAYYAAFKGGLGVQGFVIAIGATSFIQSLVVGSIISRWDWEAEVRNSQRLLSTISSSSSGGDSGAESGGEGAGGEGGGGGEGAGGGADRR